MRVSFIKNLLELRLEIRSGSQQYGHVRKTFQVEGFAIAKVPDRSSMCRCLSNQKKASVARRREERRRGERKKEIKKKLNSKNGVSVFGCNADNVPGNIHAQEKN